MLQCAHDERVLLAPDDSVAGFLASTYRFDRVEVGAVSAGFGAGQLVVTTENFDARFRIGGPARVDRLLRLVPRRLATSPRWLRVIDPVAARVVPGVRTYGTAGNGRVESSTTVCGGHGASPRSTATTEVRPSEGWHRCGRR
jgi:hypothetical protein